MSSPSRAGMVPSRELRSHRADGREFGYDAHQGDVVMPIHDWSRVPSGLFHDFHQSWSIRIKDALNAGRLPDGVEALVEQRAGQYVSRANRIVVTHHLGRIIAVIEIVSSGNKD